MPVPTRPDRRARRAAAALLAAAAVLGALVVGPAAVLRPAGPGTAAVAASRQALAEIARHDPWALVGAARQRVLREQAATAGATALRRAVRQGPAPVPAVLGAAGPVGPVGAAALVTAVLVGVRSRRAAAAPCGRAPPLPAAAAAA